MRTHQHLLTLIAVLFCLTSLAYGQDDKDKGNDATQNFASPLGLGSGATLAVTQKGTAAAAAVESQMDHRGINFWQVGVSGTTDKNGQTQVFSSSDKDAPGFKAKIGLGRSSMIRQWQEYTTTGGAFKRQAWCRDLIDAVNKTLPFTTDIPSNASCPDALKLIRQALTTTPPVDIFGKPDEKTTKLDTLVIEQLTKIAGDLTVEAQKGLCDMLKDSPNFYQYCADSGKPQKSVEDQKKAYPALYANVSGQPPAFQWKLSGNWAPTLTSVNYRAVTNGVPDLATEQHWTRLLNTGTIDLAIYYRRLSFGIQGGYGDTVRIKTANVCNTTTVTTFTAQACDTVMIGKPAPKTTSFGTAALALNPLPLFGKSTLFSPGAEVLFSYETPKGGGHKSQLAVPFFLAPLSSPIALVFGIQPTWDWNTDPNVGKKFSVSLFISARPEVTK